MSEAVTEYWQDETAGLATSIGRSRNGSHSASNQGEGKSNSIGSSHSDFHLLAQNPLDREIANHVVNDPQERRSTVVMRRFVFNNTTKTSSVVTAHEGTNTRWIVCKGSYQQMAKIAHKVPHNYTQMCEAHAQRGSYCIVIGARELKLNEDVDDRASLEKDIRLLGLMVFVNPIKYESRQVLQEICDGGIKPMICTGDNELAAAAVARKMGLLPNHCLLGTDWDGEVEFAPCLAPTADEPIVAKDNGFAYIDGEPELPTAMFSNRGASLETLRTKTVSWHNNSSEFSAQNLAKTSASDRPPLIITGAALRTLHRDNKLEDYIHDIKVVANATAQDKLLLIRCLQSVGEVVGMVGDGWNDSGALRQAHIGLALRVSPMASRVCAFSTQKDDLYI